MVKNRLFKSFLALSLLAAAILPTAWATSPTTKTSRLIIDLADGIKVIQIKKPTLVAAGQKLTAERIQKVEFVKTLLLDMDANRWGAWDKETPAQARARVISCIQESWSDRYGQTQSIEAYAVVCTNFRRVTPADGELYGRGAKFKDGMFLSLVGDDHHVSFSDSKWHRQSRAAFRAAEAAANGEGTKAPDSRVQDERGGFLPLQCANGVGSGELGLNCQFTRPVCFVPVIGEGGDSSGSNNQGQFFCEEVCEKNEFFGYGIYDSIDKVPAEYRSMQIQIQDLLNLRPGVDPQPISRKDLDDPMIRKANLKKYCLPCGNGTQSKGSHCVDKSHGCDWPYQAFDEKSKRCRPKTCLPKNMGRDGFCVDCENTCADRSEAIANREECLQKIRAVLSRRGASEGRSVDCSFQTGRGLNSDVIARSTRFKSDPQRVLAEIGAWIAKLQNQKMDADRTATECSQKKEECKQYDGKWLDQALDGVIGSNCRLHGDLCYEGKCNQCMQQIGKFRDWRASFDPRTLQNGSCYYDDIQEAFGILQREAEFRLKNQLDLCVIGKLEDSKCRAAPFPGQPEVEALLASRGLFCRPKPSQPAKENPVVE